MRRAYLWIPAELIELDLEPLLAGEQRRLAWQEDRLFEGPGHGIPSQARRTADLIGHLELLIAAARDLPPHDEDAARNWITHLTDQADRLGRRWPGWLYRRVAADAAWRLLPHLITNRDVVIRARVGCLRAQGALRIIEAPRSTPGGAATRRPERRSRPPPVPPP